MIVTITRCSGIQMKVSKRITKKEKKLIIVIARVGYYNLRLRVRLKQKHYIRVDIRELNGVLSTKCLPYIYQANSLYYTKPSLL